MILRTRILALASLLAVLFLSLITYTLSSFWVASSQLNQIVERNMAIEQSTELLHLTILKIRSDIWDTMVFDQGNRRPQVDRLDEQARVFYQGLRDLSARTPSFETTSKELRFLFQGYYQFGSTILDLPSVTDFVGQAALVGKFRQNEEALLNKLDRTLQESKEQFYGVISRLNADFSQTTITAFVLAALVTMLSFVVALLMAGRLARPLERLTKVAHQVTDGNYSVRPELTSSGEIRDLTETFISMLDQIQDYSGRMEDLVRARTDALTRTNAVMVKELRLAQKVQGALIPRELAPRGPISAAGVYLPMEELGGDFYDAFERAPGHWTLVMADVSGHGVPAALVTAMVKICLGQHRTLLGPPETVLDAVNRELCLAIGDLKRYVTLLLCNLDLSSETLSFCNAGHNELLVRRRDGSVETYGPNSGVVGLRHDEVFLSQTVGFHQGDSLLLFTDGLTEARGDSHREFGLERVLEMLSRGGAQGPQALTQQIIEAVQDHSRGHPRQDDIAVLAARWDQTPSSLQSKTVIAQSAEELYRNSDFEGLLSWTQQGLDQTSEAREASRLHHWKAMALLRLRRFDDALQAWNLALELDPEHHRARRNRDFLLRIVSAGPS